MGNVIVFVVDLKIVYILNYLYLKELHAYKAKFIHTWYVYKYVIGIHQYLPEECQNVNKYIIYNYIKF